MRPEAGWSFMGMDIIPYDPYHPHLGYTLAITCIAWVSVALYCRYRLRHHPKHRITLYALAIGLPIFAEAMSYLIFLLRPAPDTPVGYILTHIHAYVIQQIPIDSFLSPTMSTILLALLVALIGGSLLRFCHGTIHLTRVLAAALPLSATPHAPVVSHLAATAAHIGHAVPPILVINHTAPLAFTTGILHPRIYLTIALLGLLTNEETIAVLCHEWAHILRRDNLWNGLVRLLRDIACFLPGTHFLWRSMVASQDEACDALAVEITHQPLALARAMVKVATAWRTYAAPPPLPLIISPFALARASPQPRVERMIYLSDVESPSAGSAVGAYVLAVVLLLLSILPALLGS